MFSKIIIILSISEKGINVKKRVGFYTPEALARLTLGRESRVSKETHKTNHKDSTVNKQTHTNSAFTNTKVPS